MEEGVLEEVQADIELYGWEKAWKWMREDKKPVSVFSIWKIIQEQTIKQTKRKNLKKRRKTDSYENWLEVTLLGVC